MLLEQVSLSTASELLQHAPVSMVPGLIVQDSVSTASGLLEHAPASMVPGYVSIFRVP
jgi:hypothetical protein